MAVEVAAEQRRRLQASPSLTFKFFVSLKSSSELEFWLQSKPLKDLIVQKDSVICAKHWPEEFEKVEARGKLRPKYPPNVWEGVPQNSIPLPPQPPRPTKFTSFTLRDKQQDEMAAFQEMDRVDYA